LNGFTYELEIMHFQSAGKFRWNEPPEMGEIDLEKTVRVSDHGGFIADHEISLDEFVEIFAVDNDLSSKEARSKIEDLAYDDVVSQIEENYGD
jgi:hypothetical protein